MVGHGLAYIVPDRRVEINDPPETEVFLDGSIKQTKKMSKRR